MSAIGRSVIDHFLRFKLPWTPCNQRQRKHCAIGLRFFDALNIYFNQVLNKLKYLSYLFFRAFAGQFNCPTQVALRGIQIGQSWQLVCVELAIRELPQRSKIP